MTFFSRPNLENLQFKQLPGSELTLSGQTQIATTSGLTLADGTGGTVIITASGASIIGQVLAYDGAGTIRLTSPSSGASTGIYTCATPTTCTVGGLPVNTQITGCTIARILEMILVPTLNPALTSPSISSFTISPTTTLYEVGYITDITGTTCFNPGTITPVYPPRPSGCTCRSAGAICYFYNAYSIPYTCLDPTPINIYCFPPQAFTTAGCNTFSACVCYSGGTQVYDSSCAPFDILSAGTTSASCVVVYATYPWYWGKITCAVPAGDCRPSVACIKHEMTGNTCGGSNTGNKVVGTSTGTLNVTFGSTASDYLWFATPVASTTKTCWYIDALNSGFIGGAVSPAGYLFPAPDTVTGVTSVGTGSWTGQSYQVYISNKQTASTLNMQLRNS